MCIRDSDYSHTVIDQFKLKELPVITVSVDMMDTGIDVPEILNLVSVSYTHLFRIAQCAIQPP